MLDLVLSLATVLLPCGLYALLRPLYADSLPRGCMETLRVDDSDERKAALVPVAAPEPLFGPLGPGDNLVDADHAGARTR